MDYVFMQTVKGGSKLALKYVTFSGIILGSSLLIQAYRNKSNPLDYTIGGAISGGLLRMHYGLYNLATGAVAGALFGSIFGVFRYAQLRIMDQTYEQRHAAELKDKIITREILRYSIIKNKNADEDKK